MDDISRRRQEDWERSLASWKNKQNKEAMYKPVSHHVSHSPKGPHEQSSFLTKFLIFLAFAIPVAILGYALYINYLPFGYEKTFDITIDESGTISPLSNEFYLTNAQGKKLLTLSNGVQGQVNLVIEPKVALKNAQVTVNVEGEGVGFASYPETNAMRWAYDWAFDQTVNSDFTGDATYNTEEACTHFNAYNEQTLSLPNSKDLFESGPMSIYVKWKPSSVSPLIGNNQQVVGHYNWEFWQNTNSVQFRVGRMNDANGSFYSISYPVNESFFNTQHEALAIYSPDTEGKGYIELWIDGKIVGRTSVGSDVIYTDYNAEKDLSLGWSSHNFGENPHFDGCIYNIKIAQELLVNERKTFENQGVSGQAVIPIIGNGRLTSIHAIVSQ